MNILTNVNPDIELLDNNQPPKYENKTVLTSASLENLNEHSETSWSEGSSSPTASSSGSSSIIQASISNSLINIENI